jgi:cytochrome c oxidase assembly protein subunit 15
MPRAAILARGIAGLIALQAAIGIATLLYQVPVGLALLHQGTAIVILTLATTHAWRLAHDEVRKPVAGKAPA